MQSSAYETTFSRALIGLMAGMIAGALACYLQLMALAALAPTRMADLTSSTRTNNLELILVSTLTWTGLAYAATGLLIVVSINWWTLHKVERRNLHDLTVMGLFLGLAAFLFIVASNPDWDALSLISYLIVDFGGITAIDGRLTSDGWFAAFIGTIVVAISGSLAGFVFWFSAYRKQMMGSTA